MVQVVPQICMRVHNAAESTGTAVQQDFLTVGADQ